MIKLFAGDNCKEDGIMPPQMNWEDKVINCEAIAIAGRYKDIDISTFDPMIVEGLDMFSKAVGTDIKFFLNGKEIDRESLYIIYDYFYQFYETIDTLKWGMEFGLDCCCNG